MVAEPPLFREVQRYSDLPPFTLLVVVGTLFGWLLVIWLGLMGRSLGALQLELWLALAIGLPLGVLLPLAYRRLRMTTEVYSDRLVVSNGLSGRLTFRHEDVVNIAVRTDDIRDDYNTRNVGELRTTRTAYTVSSSQGVQLHLSDGRLILIGSLQPEALGAALTAARRPALPAAAAVRPRPRSGFR